MTQGTKQFWNDPTAQEEFAAGRRLNLLAAELVSDARYEYGVAGEGLYADAKVFGPYHGAVEELAPHIGVNPRQWPRPQGEAEGRKGPIIQSITSAQSVDYVTTPGAGGEIIRMFEAARSTRPITSPLEESMSEADQNALQELKEAVARAEAEKCACARR